MMQTTFSLDYAPLSADPRFAGFVKQLQEQLTIDSQASFNRFCQAACRAWPGPLGRTTGLFSTLLERIQRRVVNVIPTGWGGVVIERHEHPEVEKYLVIRKGRYLALEKHELKDERLEVREGAGLLLWRRPDEQPLSVEAIRPGDRFHLQPGMEHCLIGTEDLLIYESSVDPKGMDRDLIFLYEPDHPA